MSDGEVHALKHLLGEMEEEDEGNCHGNERNHRSFTRQINTPKAQFSSQVITIGGERGEETKSARSCHMASMNLFWLMQIMSASWENHRSRVLRSS